MKMEPFVSQLGDKKSYVLPEFALTFVIHLLAHLPHLSESKELMERAPVYLEFFLDEIFKADNYWFLAQLIASILQCKDAQDPTISNTRMIGEIAMKIVRKKSEKKHWDEKKLFLGDIMLPKALYVPATEMLTESLLPLNYDVPEKTKKQTGAQTPAKEKKGDATPKSSSKKKRKGNDTDAEESEFDVAPKKKSPTKKTKPNKKDEKSDAEESDLSSAEPSEKEDKKKPKAKQTPKEKPPREEEQAEEEEVALENKKSKKQKTDAAKEKKAKEAEAPKEDKKKKKSKQESDKENQENKPKSKAKKGTTKKAEKQKKSPTKQKKAEEPEEESEEPAQVVHRRASKGKKQKA